MDYSDFRQFVGTGDAARVLRVSPRTLEKWRTTRESASGRHRGPAWFRLANGRVGYRVEDLAKWIAARHAAVRAMGEMPEPSPLLPAGG